MASMSPHETSILTTLTLKVPFLTAAQAARTWWSDSGAGQGAAAKSLRHLVRGGFLWSGTIEAHPEVSLKQPLFAWQLGEDPPGYSTITAAARRRFPSAHVRHEVYLATAVAAKVFGGTPAKLKAVTTTHDLHLAAVYLDLLRKDPERAERWVSEATLAPQRQDQVLPDAALIGPDGRLETVVEFVGTSYTAERLKNIHLDCEAREVPYEFW